MEDDPVLGLERIRAGTIDDVAACASLWAQAVALRDGHGSSQKIERRAIRKLGKKWTALIVAADSNGLIAGFSLLLAEDQNVDAGAHVSMLAVHPRMQTSGVGTRLLIATHEAAAAQGVSELTLRVLTSNEGARRLYESAGWISTGEGRFQDTGRAFTGYRYSLLGQGFRQP